MKIKTLLNLGQVLGLALSLGCAGLMAQATNAPGGATLAAGDGDAAWKEVRKALQPPPPPAEWRSRRPTPGEIEAFRAKQREGLERAIDKTREFHTRFPDHAKAADAKQQELELLRVSVQIGNTNRVKQLEALEAERLKDPKLTAEERFEIRAGMVARQIDQSEDAAENEKTVRALQKEFPDRGEIYDFFLQLAEGASPEQSRKLLNEIAAAANAGEETRERAKMLLKKLELVGQPLPIKFTSVQGQEIDLARMKGKVVLIDFWATWCGPCMMELPNVKAAYEKLRDKGFEIVGISFDQDKEDLQKVLAEEKMTWPQYFDGKGWKNQFGQEFGIQSIPAMWLVDKQGRLRDLNARHDLVGKVERLLAEK